MKRKFLGEFEELVLLAVLKLGSDEAYGVSIAEAIEDATGKRVAVGALYTALSRLEEKGFLTSRLGEPTESRGGRAKRYFSVDGEGLKAIQQFDDARERLRGFRPAHA